MSPSPDIRLTRHAKLRIKQRVHGVVIDSHTTKQAETWIRRMCCKAIKNNSFTRKPPKWTFMKHVYPRGSDLRYVRVRQNDQPVLIVMKAKEDDYVVITVITSGAATSAAA